MKRDIKILGWLILSICGLTGIGYGIYALGKNMPDQTFQVACGLPIVILLAIWAVISIYAVRHKRKKQSTGDELIEGVK